MNLRRLFSQLSIAAVAVIASVGIQAFAFTEPTTAPPQANAYAPINTGPSGQYKSGGLLLNVGSTPAPVGLAVHGEVDLLGNAVVGTSVTAPKYCIGSSCITSWPSSAANNITGSGTGSGTAGNIARFNGTNSLTNANIYDNGGYIGINTASPGSYRLNVSGNTYTSGTGNVQDVYIRAAGKWASQLGASSRSGLIVAGCFARKSPTGAWTRSCWGGATDSGTNTSEMVTCPSGTTLHGGGIVTDNESMTSVCVQN